MFWPICRSFSPLILAAAALLCSAPGHAQGYDIRPWPAGQSAHAWVGTDLQGQTWQLADLRGKAVLINFWASWCAPCLAEMPSLQSLPKAYGRDKLVVLAVNFKESGPVVQRYVQRNNLTLPVLLDPLGTMARVWGVSVFPTTVLVAADGRVVSVVRGEFDWSGPQAAQLLAPLMPPLDPVNPQGARR